MSDEPLHRNRERALSFGEVADAYDRSRPSYPAALLDDLVADGPARALDVGCGTGILSRQLAERGVEVLGIDPDDQMAAFARRRGLTVEVATFETWDAKGRRFPLLVAGQSWHWVDPQLGAAKAAEVVEPLGLLALVWNHAVLPKGLHGPLDALYSRYEDVRPTVLHKPTWHEHDSAESRLEATGAFGATDHREYAWTRTYTSSEWTDQLGTHSDHRRMPDAKREELIAEVGRVIDAAGGSFEMHYLCHASLLRHIA